MYPIILFSCFRKCVACQITIKGHEIGESSAAQTALLEHVPGIESTAPENRVYKVRGSIDSLHTIRDRDNESRLSLRSPSALFSLYRRKRHDRGEARL